MNEELFCEYCKKLLEGNRKRFCNTICMNKKLKTKNFHTSCGVCGKEVKIEENRLKKQKMIYCSEKCKLIEKERRLNLSRKTVQCNYCGKFIIRPPSLINERNYCDQNCKNKYHSENLTGDKSAAWKGGKIKFTKILRGCERYSQWRKNIFFRDKCRCVECNKSLSLTTAHIHHLKELNILIKEFLEIGNEPTLEFAYLYKDFWDMDNAITLCRNCHGNYHPNLIRKN